MDAANEVAARTGWQHDLYDLLRRHDITQFAYVPDAGHAILIDRSLADPAVHSIALTTEEEGVALIAGADLGGARGVLLMQSSGVGNCINMLSLIKAGRFPFLALVSMRGDFGEGNPWQFPMGQATQRVLEAMELGVPVVAAASPVHAEVIVDGGSVVGEEDGPLDAAAFGAAVVRAVTDDDAAGRLRILASDRARAFSWRESAERVWQLHADL